MPRLYHRYLRINRELETPVRRAQGALDLARAGPAGEDEAEVAGTLGQRDEDLVCPGGDPHVLHAGNATRFLDAIDVPEHPAARNRNHHHTRCERLALPPLGRLAKRVTEQQLLERDQGTVAFSEAQRASA